MSSTLFNLFLKLFYLLYFIFWLGFSLSLLSNSQLSGLHFLNSGIMTLRSKLRLFKRSQKFNFYLTLKRGCLVVTYFVLFVDFRT
jgi:hypothetical protein